MINGMDAGFPIWIRSPDLRLGQLLERIDYIVHQISVLSKRQLLSLRANAFQRSSSKSPRIELRSSKLSWINNIVAEINLFANLAYPAYPLVMRTEGEHDLG